MKRPTALSLVVLALLAAFAWFYWPTRWEYPGGTQGRVRINRLTGDRQVWSLEHRRWGS